MISTTNNFITAVAQTSRQFKARFLYGNNDSVLDCDIKKITCHKGSCGDELSIGCVYASYIDVELARCSTSLDGVKLKYQIGLLAGSSYEWITVGVYTALDSTVANGSVTFSAVSTLSLIGNDAYSTSLTYPATVNQVIGEFSETITLKGLAGTGSITKAITGTKREVLGTIAGLLGGFVTEDNSGNIVIAKYGSGGSASIAPFRSLSLPEFRKTAFSVTGIHITVKEAYEDEDGQEVPEEYFETGTPVIFQKNEWMTQALFNSMTPNFVGMSFELGTVGISLGDPRLEAWDKIVVTDLGNNTHTIHCFEVVHTFDGGFSTEVIAEVTSTASSDTQVKGAMQKFVERLDTDIMAVSSAAAQANHLLGQMEDAAEAADTTLTGIYADAEAAHSTLADMQTAATAANTTLTAIYQDAEDAKASAAAAQSSADSALVSLATVEDVVGVLNWITAHGTMTANGSTALDPSKVYFVRDNNGDYTVGSYNYSIVSEPKAADRTNYYTLSVDESVQNYVATHVAVNTEGLWLIPDQNGTPTTNGKKILIATGAGSSYTTAGTYIIDRTSGADRVVASFTANGAELFKGTDSVASFGDTARVGKEANGYARTLVDSGGLQIYRKDSSVDWQVAHLGFGSALTESGSNQNRPYFTLGERRDDYPIGAYSLVAGHGAATGASATALNSSFARGTDSHSEGSYTVASGYGSHAEGFTDHTVSSDGLVIRSGITASGDGSHAEGYASSPSGQSDYDITASGIGSHAEGYAVGPYGNVVASGDGSHAQNAGTKALSDFQTAIGRCNEEDSNDTYAFIIGNGADNSNRSNALTVDWAGNVDAAGKVNNHSKRKSLWSGTYSSGTLTVAGISNYHTLEVTFSGAATHALCFTAGSGTTGYLRGMGGYCTATATTDYYVGLTLDYTTDTLTWVNCIQRQMNISTKAFTTSALTISGIIGIE